MLAAAGFLVATLGIAAACCASRLPGRTTTIETGGGMLLLAGFALVGLGLPALV